MQQRERLSVEFPAVLERFLVHSFVFRLVRFATNNVAFTERYRLELLVIDGITKKGGEGNGFPNLSSSLKSNIDSRYL